MIALDSSAVVAIALDEPEAEPFERAIAAREAIIGAPSLLETRLVLSDRIPSFAEAFLDGFIDFPEVRVISFTFEMYRAAVDAFERFGKGRGHPAKLNFGDCMAYAVARHYGVPLLYKGDDFSQTDITAVLL
jgi:ribonuclease VapC